MIPDKGHIDLSLKILMIVSAVFIGLMICLGEGLMRGWGCWAW